MPAYDVQGPFGLQFSLQTHIPGRLSVVYESGEQRMLASRRTHSQPIGESSQGPSFGRRTQSELSLDIPMPTYQTPAADNAAPEQRASAPSPAPTEIIPADLTPEEIVADIQSSGVKVRDFAYESAPPISERAPELFDPVLAWNHYETTLGNSDTERNAINGRHLRRLLDIGWVSEADDGERWLKKDREALEMHDSRPHYPWKAFNITKPKKEQLREVATTRFHWVNADQLVNQFAPLRRSGIRPSPIQKRSADARAESAHNSKFSPRSKKRRLSNSAAPVEAQPTPSQHIPLALVNGKPPQQFPAGQPSLSSSPPSLSVPLSRPILGRSLVRQTSMASVSSVCPADPPKSDSRTTLTQGADS
ncbi:hypothetical protein HYDPIDRAFT_30368 [Hydnomerulius pinastri MD-312]|uniref:Uncharacterized protein n=1 Tax=Hydnomerulius pinastri MD-312 TaxID=994086 RepID=A0A0C9VW46_9AGAM|nr:hypothetical protein HYDPIDRAFT_30368 [Hydnomerulius pinastri MD-312]